MLDFRNFYSTKNKSQKIFFRLLLLMFLIVLFVLSFTKPINKTYFLFLEFEDAYGLKEGTSVKYKGVNIGAVTRISLHVNKVVVLLTIRSSDILIPYETVFEANQIGLFNDIVININPSFNLVNKNISHNDLHEILYQRPNFIPHNSYIKAYKGISYDDLIRSTTRISQRFDDPRFFSLFYLFLKNSIYISDEILVLIYNISIISQLFMRIAMISIF